MKISKMKIQEFGHNNQSTKISLNSQDHENLFQKKQTLQKYFQSVLSLEDKDHCNITQNQIQNVSTLKNQQNKSIFNIRQTNQTIELSKQIDQFKLISKYDQIKKQFEGQNYQQSRNQSLLQSNKLNQIKLDSYQNRKRFYGDVFKDVQLNQECIKQNTENGYQYKIIKLPYHTAAIQVILRSHSDQFDLIQYQVFLSYFKINIILKNISKKAYNIENLIGLGTFGKIYKINKNQNQFAVKRLYYRQNNRDETLIDCIREYSMYKLASFLKIGPKIQFMNQIDVVCYDNAIQFFMELCEPGFEKSSQQKIKDLKQDLMILHSMKIVHRDIKPANILYSKYFNKFVFADFGTSHPIKQQINIMTYSGICGTLNFLPNYIKTHYAQNKNFLGYLDLYYLDAFALLKSIQILTRPALITIEGLKKQLLMQKYYKHKNFKNQDKTDKQLDYSKFPQLQKIHFRIRIEGFNCQVQQKLKLLIEQIQDVDIQVYLKKKLQKYAEQFKNKQLHRFVWSKKCSKIEQYFINKGYQKIAEKMLLQRQTILTKSNDLRNTKQLTQVFQYLIKFYLNYDIHKAKIYLQKLRLIIEKNRKNEHDYQFIYQNLDLLIKIAEEQPRIQFLIYNFLIKHKSQSKIWHSLNDFAKTFSINKKYKTTQQLYEISLMINRIIKSKLNIQQNDCLEEVKIHFNLAKINCSVKQYQISINQAEAGLKLIINQYLEEHKYYQISGLLHNIIGFNYIMLSKLVCALNHLKQAQQILLNYGKSTYLSQILNNIGYVNRIRGNFKLALQYQLRALDIRIESAGQNSLTTSIVIFNLIYTYLQKGHLVQSLKYLRKYENIFKTLKMNESYEMLQCKSQMLFIYIKLGNYDMINLLVTQIDQLKKYIKKQRIQQTYYKRMRSYYIFNSSYEICEKSFQISKTKVSHALQSLQKKIKLYLDYLEFCILIKKPTTQTLQIVQQLINDLAADKSYYSACYHYLYSKILFQNKQINECLIQLLEAIQLFQSYFQYHHQLIDCYMLLLQVRIMDYRYKEQYWQQLREIYNKIQKIVQHHGLDQNTSIVKELKTYKNKLMIDDKV